VEHGGARKTNAKNRGKNSIDEHKPTKERSHGCVNAARFRKGEKNNNRQNDGGWSCSEMPPFKNRGDYQKKRGEGLTGGKTFSPLVEQIGRGGRDRFENVQKKKKSGKYRTGKNFPENGRGPQRPKGDTKSLEKKKVTSVQRHNYRAAAFSWRGSTGSGSSQKGHLLNKERCFSTMS